MYNQKKKKRRKSVAHHLFFFTDLSFNKENPIGNIQTKFSLKLW